MSKKEKIRVKAGEDILAYIPHSLGYWPRQSVVCLAMEDSILEATMRLELPENDQFSITNYSHYIAEQFASYQRFNGVLIAIYDDEDWLADDPPESLAVFRELRAAFESRGIAVKDAWFIGSDHWRTIDCLDESCCPWPGQSNSLIGNSLVNTELVFRGSVIASRPEDQIPELIAMTNPEGWPQRRKQIDHLLSGLRRTSQARSQLELTLGIWDQALEAPAGHPDTEVSCFLVAALQDPMLRDAFLVSLSLSSDRSLSGAIGLEIVHPQEASLIAPRPDMTGLLPRNVTGGDFPENPLEAADSFAAALLGGDELHAHKCDAPDWPRIDRGEKLLLELCRLAEGHYCAPMLTMLGWIHWCRGRGTWAAAYLDAATDADANYHLARLLQQLLASGHIAAWARNQATAWPGYQANEDPATDVGATGDSAADEPAPDEPATDDSATDTQPPKSLA